MKRHVTWLFSRTLLYFFSLILNSPVTWLPLKQFMWILCFIILTEKLNAETCRVITCMSLHAKYVISLQQFFHLSQIKAKGFSPLLNNQKVSVHFFKYKRKTSLSNSLKQFMWMLWFIILTEKLHEETCGVITYMILHVSEIC